VDNMGYALPITQVKYLCENLLENDGVVKRAMLGITVTATSSQAYYDEEGRLRIKEEFCVGSTDIETTAAAYGKLKPLDVIQAISINGVKTTFTRRYQLNDLLLTVRKGDTVVLTVVRDGEEKEVEIVYDQDAFFTEYK